MGNLQIGVQQQLQAATAGLFFYPQVAGGHKDFVVGDEFTRDDLIPTDGYPVYTVAGTGTEAVSISSDSLLRMQTGGTSGKTRLADTT